MNETQHRNLNEKILTQIVKKMFEKKNIKRKNN